MPTKKISISFSENCIDIYNYLKTKQNISYYICQVVKAEMNNKNTLTPELKVQIEAIIESILKDKHVTIHDSLQSEMNSTNKNILSTEDISLIKDLF